MNTTDTEGQTSVERTPSPQTSLPTSPTHPRLESNLLSAQVQKLMSEAKIVYTGEVGEDPRFTAYLMRTWSAGTVASVNTPAYVRDNIHASLLAQCDVKCLQRLPKAPGFTTHHPSGYVETQGTFAQRFAAEMRTRFDMPCQLDMKDHTEFAEPRVRINTEPAVPLAPGWDEKAAWDEIAGYYHGMRDDAFNS